MVETIGIIIGVIYVAYSFLQSYLNPDETHSGFPNGSGELAARKMNSDNREVIRKIDAKLEEKRRINPHKLYYRYGRDILEMDPSINDPKKQAYIMNATYKDGNVRYSVVDGKLVDHHRAR